MGMTVEKRLRKLEDELKAMKVCYDTAGSLVTMYVQKMEQFTVGGGSGWHNVTVRFTPKYGIGHNNLITLVAIVDSNTYYVAPFTVNPQNGSGSVEITVYELLETQKVEIIASGTSLGTFTRLS